MSSNLTFVFTGEVPKKITLGYGYLGPRNANKAEYNSGKGWKPYRGNIIPIEQENQISFRGDWRDENGSYSNMFSNTFIKNSEGAGSMAMFGQLEHNASNTPYGYAHLFRGCNDIVYMRDNPIPKLTGRPAIYILLGTFKNMTGLTILPEGFLDLSGMHGEPSTDMLTMVCENMKSIHNPHIFKLGSGIKFNSTNVVNSLRRSWSGMKNWTGTVLWGDKVLFNQITPKTPSLTVFDCPNMMGHHKIHRNWGSIN